MHKDRKGSNQAACMTEKFDQSIRPRNKDNSSFCQNPVAKEYVSTMCLQNFKLVEAADSFSPFPGVKILCTECHKCDYKSFAVWTMWPPSRQCLRDKKV